MKNIAQKEERKQPKIKTQMSGKGLTVHAGLLPALTFMEKLSFRKRVQEAVRKERGANAQYQIVDAIQMVVIGLIAGATSMVQITKIWADEVLKKMAGWKEIPVDTTIGRIMKLVTQGDIVELTGIIHRFRGQVWKGAVRSGHKLRSALSEMWIDVDSTVDGVYGNQQGAEVGYNPRSKGQWSYHPVIAFVAETKEILHSWFRGGSAYTSNGVVEFMKECMAYTKKRVRVIFRGDSGFFSGELLDYLESVSAGYLIKVKIKNLIGLLEGQKWEIKECKSQMNVGQVRTGEFLANAALFQCAVLAYNLLKWMALLTGGAVQQWEVKTMRLWLIRVAGKLTKGSRQLVLKLPEKFLHQEEWRAWEGMSVSVEFG